MTQLTSAGAQKVWLHAFAERFDLPARGGAAPAEPPLFRSVVLEWSSWYGGARLTALRPVQVRDAQGKSANIYKGEGRWLRRRCSTISRFGRNLLNVCGAPGRCQEG